MSRTPLRSAWSVAVSGILFLTTGCGDGGPARTPFGAAENAAPGNGPAAPDESGTDPSELTETPTGVAPNPDDVNPDALLRSVVQLVREAPTNPGGQHFDIAKDYLNQYFAGASPNDFRLADAARSYLTEQFGANAEAGIASLENPAFTIRDSRHIEDCLLLQTIARRVAGNGEDMVRVRRIFDWLMRQVQLVPPGSLAPPGGIQAQARPYDVLLRGMATEQGAWAERSWTFIALCRQIGVDVGLIAYKSPNGAQKAEPEPGPEQPAAATTSPDDYQVWICAALIDGVPYLFDCGLGMPIPGPDGTGVATLEQAATDPSILARLDLPGRPYSTRQADLAAGKLLILVDSTLNNLSPRMRQLQLQLSGRDRMVLYRDPAELDARFAQALGPRFGGTRLWAMPMQVENLLFRSPQFVEATQYAIAIFDAKLPLLAARLSQLRGEANKAVESYAGFRFEENPVMNDGSTPVPPDMQRVLDVYATYYLGLAKLDQGEGPLAEDFFRQSLELLPPLGEGMPYFGMYRWGAQTNLAYLNDQRGNLTEAIRYYAMEQPTPQGHGNLLRARELIARDPFAHDTTPAPAPSQTKP